MIKGKDMVFLGTVAYIGFSIFCINKGDEWGAGALILWVAVSFIIASTFGTV